MAKISNQSKLYILRYPEEEPVVYKIGSGVSVSGRVTNIRRVDTTYYGYQGYTKKIEIIGVYFVEKAHRVEVAIGKLFKEYRVERGLSLRTFGTTEIYKFTELELQKVHHVVTGVFMDILNPSAGYSWLG